MSYTQIYDDGSSTFYDDKGGMGATDINGVKASYVNGAGEFFAAPGYNWNGDAAESAKLSQFYPSQGGAWYEQAALYGLTRGIDAAFMSATANKTAAPATYAGQNGKTYVNGQAPGGAGSNGMLLLILAGVAIYAIAG